ncbi:hypothetical protein ACVWW5_006721 [Bradyrhizobium sp. LM3.4]
MKNRLTTTQSAMTMRRWGPPGIAILAAIVALAAASPAIAAKQARQPAEAVAQRAAGEPIMAIVSIKSQQVTFYDADGWIFRAPVSTGTTGRETPAGVFAIVEKDKDHHSTMYDDAWMPNMQRITWNGIALHGGPLPGYAASHGCVRMPFGFAEGLFEKTNIGMRVIISPNDAAPVDFSHPSLFVPKREAITAAPGRIDKLSGEAEEATRAADDAKKAASAAAKDAVSLPASLRKLEQQKTRADAELAFADKKLATAKTDQARAQAEELKQKVATKAADATSALDAAKAAAQPKRDAVAATKEAAKVAATKKADAVKAATDAKLALEPVSVYISRATQKLYVRRNTHKPAPDGGGEVFDTSIEVPVTIRNPDLPLGTHIFHGDGEERHGPALERGHDRKRRRRQGRARPHHHPAGGVGSHRADGIAALVDRHLGRAAERRDQLPNRVRCRAEQPSAGRLHHAQADCGAADGNGKRRRLGQWRQRFWFLFPAAGPATGQSAPPARRAVSVLSARTADAAEFLVKARQTEARRYRRASITIAWILPSTAPDPWRVRIASATMAVAA